MRPPRWSAAGPSSRRVVRLVTSDGAAAIPGTTGKVGWGGIVLRGRDEERAVRLVVGLTVVRLDSIALIAVICVFGRASEFTLDAANAGLMIGPLSVRRSAAGVAT